MKLTPQEQRICDVFSREDGTGKIQCDKCPLNTENFKLDCKFNEQENISDQIEGSEN